MSASAFATTPEPPYFAVIFTSQRTPEDRGYDVMAARMVELATAQPGFLGVESVRDAGGLRHHGFLLAHPGRHPGLARTRRTSRGAGNGEAGLVCGLSPAYLRSAAGLTRRS